MNGESKVAYGSREGGGRIEHSIPQNIKKMTHIEFAKGGVSKKDIFTWIIEKIVIKSKSAPADWAVPLCSFLFALPPVPWQHSFGFGFEVRSKF